VTVTHAVGGRAGKDAILDFGEENMYKFFQTWLHVRITEKAMPISTRLCPHPDRECRKVASQSQTSGKAVSSCTRNGTDGNMLLTFSAQRARGIQLDVASLLGGTEVACRSDGRAECMQSKCLRV